MDFLLLQPPIDISTLVADDILGDMGGGGSLVGSPKKALERKGRRGCRVMAKGRGGGGVFSWNSAAHSYFTATDACLFESMIHRIKPGLLETFHETFGFQVLLTHMESKRFSSGLVQTQIQSFSKITLHTIRDERMEKRILSVSETHQDLNLRVRSLLIYLTCSKFLTCLSLSHPICTMG